MTSVFSSNAQSKKVLTAAKRFVIILAECGHTAGSSPVSEQCHLVFISRISEILTEPTSAAPVLLNLHIWSANFANINLSNRTHMRTTLPAHRSVNIHINPISPCNRADWTNTVTKSELHTFLCPEVFPQMCITKLCSFFFLNLPCRSYKNRPANYVKNIIRVDLKLEEWWDICLSYLGWRYSSTSVFLFALGKCVVVHWHLLPSPPIPTLKFYEASKMDITFLANTQKRTTQMSASNGKPVERRVYEWAWMFREFIRIAFMLLFDK